jgi:thymidylate synthase (FAD)
MTDIKFSSDMTVKLIDSMGSDASILSAMLVSTTSYDQIGEKTEDHEAAQGRINFLMKNRHGTPFEHAAMTFYVEAPIAVFREWHRHRIGISYNETSGRYKQLDPKFYIPSHDRPLVQVGKPGAYSFVPGTLSQWNSTTIKMMNIFEHEYHVYESLLADGIAKEVARGVLGVYIYSSMYVTMNPRSLMSYLSLRTHNEEAMFESFPMYEIEKCAEKIEEEFANLFPLTYRAYNTFGRVSP